jgi:beta-RFAP synthase
MSRVEAPSRLHFGFFSLPSADTPDDGGIPARQFGGVGLMIERPGISLSVNPARSWMATGPGAARALAFAKVVCAAWHIGEEFEINVERCPPEHIGLGTGTQLGLAVARALAIATDRTDVAISDLAKLVGRGRRSALGVHGFAHGGFLVEAGKSNPEAISPLVARSPFPNDWSVLLLIPRSLHGDHGQREAEAFQQLAKLPPNAGRTEHLCRLVLLGLLPALIEKDLETFGEALYEFNRRVGEMFEPWQGDVFAHPLIAQIIRSIREAGLKGVGQSSWGPTVYAIVRSDNVDEIVGSLAQKKVLARDEIIVTQASNVGFRAG